jgi:predicted N-acetyltransferase YhbS
MTMGCAFSKDVYRMMIIRLMSEQDLSFAAESTAAEGWASETRGVFESLMAYHPEGCFIAEENGQRVGMIAALPYRTTGFLGELVVRKDARGNMVGPRLFHHAIQYLQDRGIESIYLDGVEAATPYYAHVGFRRICRSLRFIGPIEGRAHSSVRPMRAQDLDAVALMDQKYFGDDRRFFLEWKWSHYPAYCKVMESGNRITGFILGMKGEGIVCAGPWVVQESVQRPVDLLESLALETGDTEIRIGVLENNKRALQAVQAIPSLRTQHAIWRMVLGTSDRLGVSEACWAIGSPAKG